MVGTTRLRVNFFMNKFRDLGFIDSNGDITVNSGSPDRDPPRLNSPDVSSRSTTLSIERCTAPHHAVR